MAVLRALAAGDTDGADDSAILNERDAAFDGHGAGDLDDAHANAAAGDCIFECFCGALEENCGAGLVHGELDAAELSAVHFLEEDKFAGGVDDGDGHEPAVLLAFS